VCGGWGRPSRRPRRSWRGCASRWRRWRTGWGHSLRPGAGGHPRDGDAGAGGLGDPGGWPRWTTRPPAGSRLVVGMLVVGTIAVSMLYVPLLEARSARRRGTPVRDRRGPRVGTAVRLRGRGDPPPPVALQLRAYLDALFAPFTARRQRAFDLVAARWWGGAPRGETGAGWAATLLAWPQAAALALSPSRRRRHTSTGRAPLFSFRGLIPRAPLHPCPEVPHARDAHRRTRPRRLRARDRKAAPSPDTSPPRRGAARRGCAERVALPHPARRQHPRHRALPSAPPRSCGASRWATPPRRRVEYTATSTPTPRWRGCRPDLRQPRRAGAEGAGGDRLPRRQRAHRGDGRREDAEGEHPGARGGDPIPISEAITMASRSCGAPARWAAPPSGFPSCRWRTG
jgi:hypothetical protein